MGWYGETWIQYPLSHSLCPTRYGNLFRAKMELGAIVNALAARLFETRDNDHAQPLSELPASYSTKLHSWYSALPPCLMPTEIVFPFQLKLQ